MLDYLFSLDYSTCLLFQSILYILIRYRNHSFGWKLFLLIIFLLLLFVVKSVFISNCGLCLFYYVITKLPNTIELLAYFFKVKMTKIWNYINIIIFDIILAKKNNHVWDLKVRFHQICMDEYEENDIKLIFQCYFLRLLWYDKNTQTCST